MNPRAAYLFVAIDQRTRCFSPHLQQPMNCANARRFEGTWSAPAPNAIRSITYRQRKKFTDRLFGPAQTGARGGKHEFEQPSALELAFDNRLTPPRSPQT